MKQCPVCGALLDKVNDMLVCWRGHHEEKA